MINGVQVIIIRLVDEAQPGWVECQLTDAFGHPWTFIEKVPILTAEALDANSPYPQHGVLPCQIVEQRPGDEVVTITTEFPWQIESVTGRTRFEVFESQLSVLE